MHSIQEKLLKLIDEKNIGGLTLRETANLVGEKLPQKIKHHLSQLERKGFIIIDRRKKNIGRINNKANAQDTLISVPIVGAANCGPQTIYADQNIEGYLRLSKRLIPKKKNVFAIHADGNSLNKAKIKGKNIENGDYVIIDSEDISPQAGDYVVSVIGGLANIKKYVPDPKNSRIMLLSESTQKYDPIFIHQDDEFRINGKVIEVIKGTGFN
jgi:repressor LexA